MSNINSVESLNSPATLADSIESQLLRYMREQVIVPGDVLPKEEELARQLRTSRPTVREGLNRLKGLGLVEARKRRGTVMRKPDVFLGLRRLAEAELFSAREAREFTELRIALEVGMSDLIYQRRTPEKLAQLRKLAGEPGKCNYPIQDEIDFHSCLMGIAGNTLVVEFRNIISKAFQDFTQELHLQFASGITRWVGHAQLCDILENGTQEEFRQAMYVHCALSRAYAARLAREQGLPPMPDGDATK